MREIFRQRQKKCFKLAEKYYPYYFYQNAFELYIKLFKDENPEKGILLNAGCGRGIERVCYKDLSEISIGIDLKIDFLLENKLHHQFVCGDLTTLPFKDKYFNFILCQNVLEHIEDPLKVFKEFSRVLKNNGVLIIMTPNIYNYVTLFSKLTPLSFHKYFNQLRGIEGADTHNTFYKANSRTKLVRIGLQSGFISQKIIMFQKWPSYLTFSKILFMLGVFYERIVNRFEILQFLRSIIIVKYKKV